MSTKPKASVHVKPCNIAQSERHNRRDVEYIKSLDPKKLYVRLDLSKNNSSYVAPEMKGVTLQQYLESIRVMVKQKTGRSMQEKDVEYTDKNGKVRVRKGCSPIRECVVVINEATRLKALLRFTRVVETRWGIKALQVHLHRDEGHYEIPGDDSTWKPNYHAHIIWDWMDHTTGKSIKLDADDMSAMQDMVAEALDMERGVKKSETGLDHLERNDFILQKQEKEKRRLEAEKRKIQSERDVAKNQARQATEERTKAEKQVNEAKEQAKKATEEKDEAKKKAMAAKSELTTIESMVAEKQTKIDKLDEDINEKNARLDVLQDQIDKKVLERYAPDNNTGWKDALLVGFSANLIVADETMNYCVEAIKDYAFSCFGGRGGNHGVIFYPEEAFAIKKVMTSLSKAFKTTLHAIGEWLVWVAHKVAKFNGRELYRADKEVKDIADGRYDGHIRKYENGNGLSR